MTTTKETTVDLWSRCYVAETEDEAVAQAHRQLDDFRGKVILVHEITGIAPGDADFAWGAIDLATPPAVEVTGMLNTESWDGDVLYPEWTIRPIHPDRKVVDRRTGKVFTLDQVRDLAVTAPGVGSREGFGDQAGPFLEPARLPGDGPDEP